MNTKLTILPLATAALLAVTACGTTGDDPGTEDVAATGGPVTVTDSRGEAVTLDAPASRVVGLEWGEVEMLVSLGVMPVGVAMWRDTAPGSPRRRWPRG